MSYSLSSWNYGAYSMANPYYSVSRTQNSSNQGTSQLFYPKRTLREDEKIVTNEYVRNLNNYKLINKNNKMKRCKSANASKMTVNSDKNYKYKLTYEEWCAVKEKQLEIFNKIKKMKESDDENMKIINQNVDIKYNEIKKQKYKEWLDRKNKEFRRKKLEELEKKMYEEEIKKAKEAEHEERMNEWFKRQAEKMEIEIINKRNEEIQMLEKEKLKYEEKKEKEKRAKLMFNEWKLRKDNEMKCKKMMKKHHDYCNALKHE